MPVHEWGRDEYLRRFAHPFWFQFFDAVMGMDWHSSGIATSVLRLIGEEKRAIACVWRPQRLRTGRGRRGRRSPRPRRDLKKNTKRHSLAASISVNPPGPHA